MPPRRLLAVLAGPALALALAVPAGADTGPAPPPAPLVATGRPAATTGPTTQDALQELGVKVAALVNLGALGEDLPPLLASMRTAPTDETTRDVLLEMWRQADDRLGRWWATTGRTLDLSSDTVVAVRPRTPDDERAVREGRPLPTRPGAYAHALIELGLLAGDEAAAVAATDPATTAPDTAPDTAVPTAVPTAGTTPGTTADTTATDGTDSVDSATDTTGSGDGTGGDGVSIVLPLVGAGAAVVISLLALWWSRRRPSPAGRSEPEGRLDVVLAATSVMASSVEPDRIVDLAVTTASMLCGGPAALVRDDGDGVAVAHQTRRPAIATPVAAELAAALRSLSGTAVLPDGAGATVLAAVAAVEPARAWLVARPARAGDALARLLDRLAEATGAALATATRHEGLRQEASTDALTGVANRRRLERDLDDGERRGGRVGVVMVDVDHFKTYNDTHGHVAGDAVLQRVAAVLAGAVRAGDVVYRYGGEEFCVLLPGAGDAEAVEVAERVRAAVRAAELPGGERQPLGCVTVSVGVSAGDARAGSALLRDADAALYRAKQAGRDRVVTA